MYKDYSENTFCQNFLYLNYFAVLFSDEVLILQIKCWEIILLPNNYKQTLIFNWHEISLPYYNDTLFVSIAS